MKKKNTVSVLLSLLGVILFFISNSSVVSGSPIDLYGYQRIILCSVAVASIGIAPFIFKSKTVCGQIIKYLIAIAFIIRMIALGGFEGNIISSTCK